MVGKQAFNRDIDDIEKNINSVSGLNRNPPAAQAVIYFILFIAGLLCVLPFVNILAMSFSEAREIYANPTMMIPKGFTLEAYKYIFKTPVLLNSFMITVFATVVGTFLNLVFTITGAYAVSKVDVPGAKLMLWIVIIPMLFGAGLIPFYLQLNSLKLINSIWVLVFPGLVAPFNLILMRNFFWSIPESIEESVRIDGAGDFTVLLKIVIPLSKAIIATIGLFYAVGHWNDYFTGLFFINDNKKWPLQVVLKSIIIDFNMVGMGSQNVASGANDISRLVLQPENIKSATIIFSIVPILLVYPFLQKYFVKGVIIGSVKG
jgi:putative aldouronate transport system permease protein